MRIEKIKISNINAKVSRAVDLIKSHSRDDSKYGKYAIVAAKLINCTKEEGLRIEATYSELTDFIRLFNSLFRNNNAVVLISTNHSIPVENIRYIESILKPNLCGIIYANDNSLRNAVVMDIGFLNESQNEAYNENYAIYNLL